MKRKHTEQGKTFANYVSGEGLVKWALGSITMNKASGGDGIPVELFQILKDNTVKVLHSICQQIWKTQQWPQDWKRSVSIPIPKKGNAKECSNYRTIALISHASKYQGNISCKDGLNKGQKKKQKILRRDGKNTQKNYTKDIFMIQITTVV